MARIGQHKALTCQSVIIMARVPLLKVVVMSVPHLHVKIIRVNVGLPLLARVRRYGVSPVVLSFSLSRLTDLSAGVGIKRMMIFSLIEIAEVVGL